MARAKLVVIQDFYAFNKQYNVGDEVPVSVATEWPGETLANRLRNGFLKHEAEVTANEEAEETLRTARAEAARIIETARKAAGDNSTVPNPSTTNADSIPSDGIPGEGRGTTAEALLAAQAESENQARGNPSSTNADNMVQDLSKHDVDNPDAGAADVRANRTNAPSGAAPQQPEEGLYKTGEELEALSKTELKEYAKEKFDTQLGDHLSHEKLVERINKLTAEKQQSSAE